MSSSPQDVLLAEMAKWKPLWCANAEVEQQPLPPWLVHQRLARFLVSEIKRVHKSHKWRTGLEREQLHSRHLASCSDGPFGFPDRRRGRVGLRNGLSRLLSAQGETMPQNNRLSHMLHGVWAKLRTPIVRAWAASVQEQASPPKLALGVLVVAAEAAVYGQEAVYAILDIDTYYEHVGRHRIHKQAAALGFARALVRFAMYRAQRRTRESAVSPGFGAGRSIALRIVQMMVLPLGQCLCFLPFSADLAVYVDDATVQVVADKHQVVEKAPEAIHSLLNRLMRAGPRPQSGSPLRIRMTSAQCSTAPSQKRCPRRGGDRSMSSRRLG